MLSGFSSTMPVGTGSRTWPCPMASASFSSPPITPSYSRPNDLAALGAVFGRGARGTRRGRYVSRRRLAARIGAQSSNSIEELAAVPQRRDAKLFQVLSREVREDRLVNVVLAEQRLILSEAKAPQPDHNVHDGAPNSGLLHIIVPLGGTVQDARKL